MTISRLAAVLALSAGLVGCGGSGSMISPASVEHFIQQQFQSRLAVSKSPINRAARVTGVNCAPTDSIEINALRCRVRYRVLAGGERVGRSAYYVVRRTSHGDWSSQGTIGTALR